MSAPRETVTSERPPAWSAMEQKGEQHAAAYQGLEGVGPDKEISPSEPRGLSPESVPSPVRIRTRPALQVERYTNDLPGVTPAPTITFPELRLSDVVQE